MSDVDLAVITAGRVDMAPVVAEIERRVALRHPGVLSERLSVFHAPQSEFADPPETAWFPAIDRLDLARHGVLLDGTDWPEGARPRACRA